MPNEEGTRDRVDVSIIRINKILLVFYLYQHSFVVIYVNDHFKPQIFKSKTIKE